MPDDEKWYTYPESEEDTGRDRRVVVKSIIIGLVVALLLGAAVYFLFSGSVSDVVVPTESNGIPWIAVSLPIFAAILVVLLMAMRGRSGTASYVGQRDPRSVGLILMIGLLVMGLALGLYVFMR